MRRPTRPRTAAATALLAISALAAGAAGAAPALAGTPSNDSFANARHIAGVPATITGDSSGASGQTGEPTADCDNGGGSASVWYWVKVSSATDLLVDLKGTAFQAGLTVWKGTSVSTLHEVECAQDETIFNNGGRARLAFPAAAGTRYYLQVSDQSGSNTGGAIELSLKKTTPPANDAFSHAKALSLPFGATVSNARTTTQSGEPERKPCDTTRGTLWYRVRLPHAATVRADTLGSAVETLVAVFNGGPSIGKLKTVGCDYTTATVEQTNGSSVTWHAAAGKTYWIQVGGFLNEWGTIKLHVRTVSPPANDDRASATHIPSVDGGAFMQSTSTRNATWQPTETVDPTCTYLSPGEHTNAHLQSVWYRYTTESSDPLECHVTAKAGVDPIVSVYTGGSFGAQQLVTCSHRSHEVGPVLLSWSPENSTTYWIQVAGESGTSGKINVSLDYATVP